MDKAPKKVVLLVDDSKLMLQMEEAVLGKEHYQLLRATTGKEAMNLIRSEKPSLVLLDFYLPDVTGEEVAKAIRANPDTAHTSIIMVTVDGSPEQQEKCFRAGCNDFILKPLDHGMLRHKVERLMSIAPRTPYRILVKITPLGKGAQAGAFVFGSSVNISATGMLVESEKSFEVGQELDVQFYLIGVPQAVSARGAVVRVDEKGFLRSKAYGILFKEVTPEVRAAIEQMVAGKLEAN
jgi:CheY-like chemotaxis protein